MIRQVTIKPQRLMLRIGARADDWLGRTGDWVITSLVALVRSHVAFHPVK